MSPFLANGSVFHQFHSFSTVHVSLKLDSGGVVHCIQPEPTILTGFVEEALTRSMQYVQDYLEGMSRYPYLSILLVTTIEYRL